VPLLLRNVQLLRDHWTNWNSWNKFTKSKVILINVLNFSLLIRWCLICKFVMLICVRNTLRSKPEKYVKQIFRFKKTYLNDFNTAKIIRLLIFFYKIQNCHYTKNNFFKLTEPGPSLWVTFSRFCLDFVDEFGIDWSHLKNKKYYLFSSHFTLRVIYWVPINNGSNILTTIECNKQKLKPKREKERFSDQIVQIQIWKRVTNLGKRFKVTLRETKYEPVKKL